MPQRKPQNAGNFVLDLAESLGGFMPGHTLGERASNVAEHLSGPAYAEVTVYTRIKQPRIAAIDTLDFLYYAVKYGCRC